MLHLFRTLRFRLTLLFVLIFGGLQIALWLAVDLLLSNYMTDRFDQTLLDRARAVVDTVAESSGEHPPTAAILRDRLTPLQAPDLFYQIRVGDGQTLLRSRNLRGSSFPLPDVSPDGPRRPHLTTIAGDPVGALPAAGSDLRLLTFLLDRRNGDPLFVQVASSLGPIQRVLSELHRLFAVFIFVSLVCGGMTAWYLTRRNLRPIGEIARRAKEISASHLDERLPLPRTYSEITEMVELINEMLQRLETEFKTQQRFIADASHELKTPLAVLLGEAHALRRHSHLSAETEAFLATVEDETRQLLRTVEGFLILSKPRRGRPPEFQSEVSVEQVVLRALNRCRRTRAGRNVRIIPRFDASDDAAEPHVRGDEDLLCSMVENLLQNAIRHSPDGKPVELTIRSEQETVRITVRDHGPGIPLQQIPHVFERFYQGGRGGTAGIGLSIVQAVAKMHGGEVAARNGSGGGCQFVVTLPTPPSAHRSAPDLAR